MSKLKIVDPISLLSPAEAEQLSESMKESIIDSVDYLTGVAAGEQSADSDRLNTCKDILDRFGLPKKKALDVEQTVHSDLPSEAVENAFMKIAESLMLKLPTMKEVKEEEVILNGLIESQGKKILSKTASVKDSKKWLNRKRLLTLGSLNQKNLL